MRHDSAAGHVEDVNRFRAAVGLRGLESGLSRADDRQHGEAAEHGLETRLDRCHDRIVTLPEFVRNAVHVNLIDASQSPKLLVGGEFNAEIRMTIQHSPAIAMSVDGQFALIADLLHACQPHAVDADPCEVYTV